MSLVFAFCTDLWPLGCGMQVFLRKALTRSASVLWMLASQQRPVKMLLGFYIMTGLG